jgi:hypothetical protein
MKRFLAGIVAFTILILSLMSAASLPTAAETPGKTPFDYPIVTTSAKKGMWLLAPPRLWIDKALKDGISKQTFIFYAATMISPGPAESTIKDLMGKEEVIPNSLIVPIRKGEKARPGDIVLSWWQSGSGMQRAYVVKGGTPTEPKVMYLDMDYDNPSGCGKKVDTLKPDSFHLLKAPFEPGTAVAVKDGSSYNPGIVIHVSGDKVLLVGSAGTMSVSTKSACTPFPIKLPGLKPGDDVMFFHYGSLRKGKVKKIDNAIGRVHVTYLFAGKDAVAMVAFSNMMRKLP